MKDVTLIQGDCLEKMKDIPDSSIDLVLCDPPYGTIKDLQLGSWSKDKTSWDNIIPTDILFEELKRVLRHNGKAVLFCQEPYTTELINHASSYFLFGSKGIWLKDSFANYLGTQRTMANCFEDFLIFRANKLTPKEVLSVFEDIVEYVDDLGFKRVRDIMLKEGRYNSTNSARIGLSKKVKPNFCSMGNFFDEKMYRFLEKEIGMPITWEEYNRRVLEFKSKYQSVFNLWEGGRYKSNVLQYSKDKAKYHPTQKPILLMEDLVKTFSNEGDMVLDFTMGSGSTGVACVNTHRKFIGIEMDENYFNIATKRIEEAGQTLF